MTIASNFRLVDKNTLENIHEATLEILSQTGIVFQSQECLKIFKKYGARVQGKTVFISSEMVEKAIASAPNSFQWEGRNSDNNLLVGKGQKGIHVSLNNGPIYIQDQDNGRRLGTKADLINLYKLAQHSSVCNINGQIPVEPSDVTHPLRYLDIFRQLLTHTDKPLFGYVGTQKEVGQMFDMIKISMGGGDDALEKKRNMVGIQHRRVYENKKRTMKIFLDRDLMCDVSDIYNPITIYRLTMAGIFFTLQKQGATTYIYWRILK